MSVCSSVDDVAAETGWRTRRFVLSAEETSVSVFVSMSKLHALRLLLRQRGDAEETSALIDGLISDHEEEIHRLRENERRYKLLDAVFSPTVRLQRSGLCFFFVASLRVHLTGRVAFLSNRLVRLWIR